MHRLMVIILPSFVILANAKSAQDLMGKSVDNLVNHLSNRAFKTSPIQYEPRLQLDQATVGKPGHLSMSRRSGALEQMLAGGHAMHQRTNGHNGHRQMDTNAVGSWGRTGVAARHTVDTVVGLSHVGHPALSQRVRVVAQAAPSAGTEYEVSQPRPTGIKWKKCPDGGIYVADISKNADPRVQLGDKLEAVSANFGDKIWKAESYQQCMMAIKTRIGPVYMKIRSRGGNTDVLMMEDDRSEFDRERGAGNYGAGTEAEMKRRFMAAKSTEKDRRKLFEDGISMFKDGKYDEALATFQMVKDLEPDNYIGDRFERTTQEYKYSAYNMACCYNALRQEEEGLGALKEALDGGWEDYSKIREDDKLAFLRESPRFTPLLERYDEPIFNNPFKNIQNPFR